jgi:DNA-binding IclR family transcriptional regulator
VGTLARGLDVLGLFAQAAPELSQKEISDALGLPMPTVHRLTAVLAERGYLERDPRTRRFRLGLEVARLIPPLLSGLRLPEFARDHVARLAAETGETVNLAVLQDSEIVYLLAQLPDDTARGAAGEEPYEKRTSATCTTWPELRRSLHRIRRDGVARSWEEYEIGLASIAVPVAWLDGPGSAAINVSLPTSRATEEFQDELVGRLRATTHRIETGLAAARPFGWTGHGD